MLKQDKATIRPALPNDGDGIATLFMRVWHISMKDLMPEGFLDRFEHEKQKEKYAGRASDLGWILLVAENNNKIVGMVGAKDNDSAPLSYKKQIKAMYIDPDFQHKGIGTLLLNGIFRELQKQGNKNVMLWCMKSNKPACSFYEKHGGTKIENIEVPEEYAIPGIPHIVYAWDLK